VCACVYVGVSLPAISWTMGQCVHMSVVPLMGVSECGYICLCGIASEYQAGLTDEEVT